MTALLIAMGVLGAGFVYDRRARRRGEAIHGGEMGGMGRKTKLDGQYRSTKWSAGT
ncbi:MAG: hypothetical protein ABIR34_11340 [Marmoricola sp.]